MINDRPKRKRITTRFIDYLEQVPDQVLLQPQIPNYTNEKKLARYQKNMYQKKIKIKKATQFLISFVNYTNQQKLQHDQIQKQLLQQSPQKKKSQIYSQQHKSSSQMEQELNSCEQSDRFLIQKYTYQPVFYQRPFQNESPLRSIEEQSPPRVDNQKSFYEYSPQIEDHSDKNFKMEEQLPIIQNENDIMQRLKKSYKNYNFKEKIFELAKKELKNNTEFKYSFPSATQARPMIAYFTYFMNTECKQKNVLQRFQSYHLNYYLKQDNLLKKKQ